VAGRPPVSRPRVCPDDTLLLVVQMRQAGWTMRTIVDLLNTSGIPTPGGCHRWWPSYVSRLLHRAAARQLLAAADPFAELAMMTERSAAQLDIVTGASDRHDGGCADSEAPPGEVSAVAGVSDSLAAGRLETPAGSVVPARTDGGNGSRALRIGGRHRAAGQVVLQVADAGVDDGRVGTVADESKTGGLQSRAEGDRPCTADMATHHKHTRVTVSGRQGPRLPVSWAVSQPAISSTCPQLYSCVAAPRLQGVFFGGGERH
jgi:hypothetical protein